MGADSPGTFCASSAHRRGSGVKNLYAQNTTHQRDQADERQSPLVEGQITGDRYYSLTAEPVTDLQDSGKLLSFLCSVTSYIKQILRIPTAQIVVPIKQHAGKAWYIVSAA